MKKLKTTLWVIGIVGCLAFSFKLVAEFYTQKAIDALATKAAEQAMRGWYKKIDQLSPQPTTLHLGQLLYANIHANRPENYEKWWAAGSYTSDDYKNGWRKTAASKASLLYSSIKKYGPSFYVAFDEALMKNKASIIVNWKDGAQRAPIMNQYSSRKYWADQRKMMDRYDKLINALLKLDDSKLNQFVGDIENQLWAGSEPSELQNWLYSNQLVGALPQSYKWGEDPYMGGWSYSWYPVDLLFLTRRVSRDFPQWTPRKFLMEAKWFGDEARKTMPS